MTACLAYTQSTITRGVAIEEASEPADIGLEHHVAALVGYRQARAKTVPRGPRGQLLVLPGVAARLEHPLHTL